MIKKHCVLFFIFILLFASIANAQHYDYKIFVPASNEKELSEAAADMAYWLQLATQKSFVIKESEDSEVKAIQLQSVNRSNLPAAIKKQILQDGQSFYLEIDGYKTARIIGSGKNSLINGIYTFLHELGFRWYMPGDAWAIIPSLDKKHLKVSKVYTPAFQNRFYFGTGGTAPIAGLDPENNFIKDFDTWNRRNRISSDYAIKGHMGEAFYAANQKELDQHPEYFCNGKIDRTGKIAINNVNAVKLYTSWALSQVTPNERFPVIGVDPADGSGGADDCLPVNMPQVKTWSDKYFWIANKVAEQSEKNGRNTLVQLYAYSNHAAPPRFELHKNVYPVIIPYAFQNVALPEHYIELWHKKMNKRPMGIYDYWNITQWSSDVPQFNIYSIPAKLRLWKNNNINTINLESTHAKGPMGHAFWLAAQMMWNTSASFDSLYNEFLTQCFGPAAPDIKRMYDRWSNNYQGAMDVVFSLHNLASASAKIRNPETRKRIAELKAYVHYLKLYYDYTSNSSAQNYNTLIGYVYSIHHLRLLQTHALQAYYIQPPTGHNRALDPNTIALRNGQGRSLEYPEIEKNFDKDLKANPVPYSISALSFDIKKASSVDRGEKAKYNPQFLNGKNQYQFYIPASQKLRIKAGATDKTSLVITDNQNKVILDKIIPGSANGFEDIDVALSKGTYVMTFGDYYRFSRIIFPANIPFFSANNLYDNAGYPLLFIYVPKDVKEIAYKDIYGPGTNDRGYWINPAGEQVQPELIQHSTYRVPVPPQFRGRVWTLNIGHAGFELLNIPKVYSLNSFDYKE